MGGLTLDLILCMWISASLSHFYIHIAMVSKGLTTTGNSHTKYSAINP